MIAMRQLTAQPPFWLGSFAALTPRLGTGMYGAVRRCSISTSLHTDGVIFLVRASSLRRYMLASARGCWVAGRRVNSTSLPPKYPVRSSSDANCSDRNPIDCPAPSMSSVEWRSVPSNTCSSNKEEKDRLTPAYTYHREQHVQTSRVEQSSPGDSWLLIPSVNRSNIDSVPKRWCGPKVMLACVVKTIHGTWANEQKSQLAIEAS